MKVYVPTTVIVASVLSCISRGEALAEDCSKDDALACYTQAIVKLQAARDEFSNAIKGIDDIRKDLASAHRDIDGLRTENADLKKRLADVESRLDSIKVVVKQAYFDVPPQGQPKGEVECPDEKDLRSFAIAAGLYLNESNEANASFLRWYAWPSSATKFNYFMINGAGTGMGHPPGHFAAYVACLMMK
ncbi:hypothetical protein CO662_22045 [Rhizobium anhuiense]|uniref:Uncharacterized protein n=1 Tax=Rhizobium anhuiense TaxID=1184720 RepID=A0ABX4J5Q9_9HYPH|nr:hypothetical protein [Rhizobium anhuiense]PDS49756.1 hypothetical protein CO662_22045 [Rhizobium anhuiense]